MSEDYEELFESLNDDYARPPLPSISSIGRDKLRTPEETIEMFVGLYNLQYQRLKEEFVKLMKKREGVPRHEWVRADQQAFDAKRHSLELIVNYFTLWLSEDIDFNNLKGKDAGYLLYLGVIDSAPNSSTYYDD